MGYQRKVGPTEGRGAKREPEDDVDAVADPPPPEAVAVVFNVACV